MYHIACEWPIWSKQKQMAILNLSDDSLPCNIIVALLQPICGEETNNCKNWMIREQATTVLLITILSFWLIPRVTNKVSREANLLNDLDVNDENTLQTFIFQNTQEALVLAQKEQQSLKFFRLIVSG